MYSDQLYLALGKEKKLLKKNEKIMQNGKRCDVFLLFARLGIQKGKKYFWLGLCKVEERNGLLKDSKNTLGSGLNSTVDFHPLILFAE